MKKSHLVVLLCLILASSMGFAQEKKNNSKGNSNVTEEKHIAVESFPKDMMVNHLDGWGGMAVAVNAMPAGADLAPLLVGLKNNSCQVPHWGYLLQGVLRLQYDDGREVVLKAGDVFYMSPGHKARVEEDIKIIDFSPDREFNDLVAHLEKKAAEMQQKEKP